MRQEPCSKDWSMPHSTSVAPNRLGSADPVRHYPYIDSLGMPFSEVLLIPFRCGEKPVGTIWVVAHGDQRRFDAEDLRLASNLAEVAGAAWGLVSALGAANAASDQLLVANARLAGQQAVLERHLAERAMTERLWRESEERLRLATEAADVTARFCRKVGASADGRSTSRTDGPRTRTTSSG